MASNPVCLTLLLLFAMIFITAAEASNELKETEMSLYFQDVSADPNATLIAVAGIQGKHWSMNQFGTVYVSDDPITEGAERNYDTVREDAVFSGTGRFTYATGYATFETYFADAPTAYSVIHCNISILEH